MIQQAFRKIEKVNCNNKTLNTMSNEQANNFKIIMLTLMSVGTISKIKRRCKTKRRRITEEKISENYLI